MAHIGNSECDAQAAPRKRLKCCRIANSRHFKDQCMRSDSVLLQDIEFSLENPRSQLERVCWTIFCPSQSAKLYFVHDCHAKRCYAALSDTGLLLHSLTVFFLLSV